MDRESQPIEQVSNQGKSENECIFCKIAKKELKAEIVYESKDYMAFLDIKPTNPGHAIVIPKKHYTNTLDTPDDVIGAMAGIAKLVAIHQIKHLKAEGFNIWINNFPAAGQVIFHVHMHVVPRFSGDGIRMSKIKEKNNMESLEEKT